jgi:hypothetical protein
VADVKKARSGPYGKVFVHDPGVLDWHVPAAELDHPGAIRAVPPVERSFLQGAGCQVSHSGVRLREGQMGPRISYG